MRPDRAWVRLVSGRRLDLLDPQPQAWDDRDLAVAFAHLPLGRALEVQRAAVRCAA